MGIRGTLTCGLVAPRYHRPRGQPRMRHSIPRCWHGVADIVFMPRGAPWGLRN